LSDAQNVAIFTFSAGIPFFDFKNGTDDCSRFPACLVGQDFHLECADLICDPQPDGRKLPRVLVSLDAAQARGVSWSQRIPRIPQARKTPARSASLTSAAEAVTQAVYRSGKPLRHPKSRTASTFSASCW